MKTPLALFRGFQLTNGVKLNGEPLREAAVYNYFHRDRVARYHQSRLVAAAALGDQDKAQESLRIVTENLFPEMEEKRQDFRKHAEDVMQTWRDQVVTIEGKEAKVGPAKKYEEEIAKLSRQKLIQRANRNKYKSKLGRGRRIYG